MPRFCRHFLYWRETDEGKGGVGSEGGRGTKGLQGKKERLTANKVIIILEI